MHFTPVLLVGFVSQINAYFSNSTGPICARLPPMGGNSIPGWDRRLLARLPNRWAGGNLSRPERSSRFKAIRALVVWKAPDGPFQSNQRQS
jgi:hypothetical protein